jgi:hypothetical protein
MSLQSPIARLRDTVDRERTSRPGLCREVPLEFLPKNHPTSGGIDLQRKQGLHVLRFWEPGMDYPTLSDGQRTPLPLASSIP